MNNSLLHWGIPGMRWGIRRRSSGGSSRPESDDHKTAKTLRGKKVSEMSNDELKKLTTRLQLEKQYKDLTRIDTSPAQKMVLEVMLNVGKQMATNYINKSLPKVMESSFNKMFGIKTNIFNPSGTDVPLTPDQYSQVIKNMNGGQ